MKYIKENWFKILAAIFLFGALGSHPYSYYQVLRWFVSVCSAYLAYDYFTKEKSNWMWVFIAVAVLLNPIFPFYFAKDTWRLLDLGGALLFMVSLFVKK